MRDIENATLNKMKYDNMKNKLSVTLKLQVRLCLTIYPITI